MITENIGISHRGTIYIALSFMGHVPDTCIFIIVDTVHHRLGHQPCGNSPYLNT